MKKILSIDGGGIRGIIPATFLSYIEDKTQKPIANCFDLIAGTSTGGIIALGITKNQGNGLPEFSAKDLLNIYLTKGHQIYSQKLSLEIKSIHGFFDELYSHENLELILQSYLGDAVLGDALTKVFVTSYDIQNRTSFFMKSWKPSDQQIYIRDAARATSAAPTYFEPALVQIGQSYNALVEGGVFLNSPAMSAYVEALKLFPEEKEFFLLSLGTGKAIQSINFEEAKHWGKVQWISPLFSCMFDGMEQVADYQLKQIMGNQYQRLQVGIYDDHQDNIKLENLSLLQEKSIELIDGQALLFEYICSKL